MVTASQASLDLVRRRLPNMPTLDELKFTNDAYYRKGNYSIVFTVAPKTGDADPAARRRALYELLQVLREETKLKISSFVDVDPLSQPDPAQEAFEANEFVDEEIPRKTRAEFVIFNKLGVTSLNKIRRFMNERMVGDANPKLTLIDPQTDQRYIAQQFTIRYLFHDFVALAKKSNWDDLEEYLKSEDKGYQELAQKTMKRQSSTKYVMPKLVIFRGAVYVQAEQKQDLVAQDSFAQYLRGLRENVVSADKEIEQLMNQVPRVADLIRKLAGQFGDRWVDELEPWQRYSEAYGQMGERVADLAEKFVRPYKFLRAVSDAMSMLTKDKRYKPDETDAALIDEIAQLTGGTLVTL